MAELESIGMQGGFLKVAVKGRLDTAGVLQVEQLFTTTLHTGGTSVAVDMSGVTFLSSMGIRMLVSAAKTLSRRGARMALLLPQALVRESILSASLDQVIAVVDSDEEAARVLAPA